MGKPHTLAVGIGMSGAEIRIVRKTIKEVFLSRFLDLKNLKTFFQNPRVNFALFFDAICDSLAQE